MQKVSFKNEIESNQLMFLLAATALLTICDQNQLVVNKKKREHDEKILKSFPKTIEETEQWIDIHFYHHEYEHLLFHSIFTSLYSLCECHLSFIAKTLEKTGDKKIKIKDITGTGIIDKYRKYLHLICDLEQADKNLAIWKEFEKFQFLRNRIVHNECYLSKEESDFRSNIGYQLIKTYSNCLVSEKGQFKIRSFQFVEDFGNLIISISQNINNEVLKK